MAEENKNESTPAKQQDPAPAPPELTKAEVKKLEQRRKLEERAAAQAALEAEETSQTAKQLQDYAEDLAYAELEIQEADKHLKAAEKRREQAQAKLDGLRRIELDAMAQKSDTEINQEYLRSEFNRRLEQASRVGEVGAMLVTQGLLSREAVRQLSLSPADKAIANRIVAERKAAAKATFKPK